MQHYRFRVGDIVLDKYGTPSVWRVVRIWSRYYIDVSCLSSPNGRESARYIHTDWFEPNTSLGKIVFGELD